MILLSLSLLTSGFCWAQGAVSSVSLESQIEARLSRVSEFAFIRAEAERLGIRAWLFGGTASAYAHYVNWDLHREGGDQRYHPSRFDYDYTNIYRSNQDMDIVIDGTPEQAQTLQLRLQQAYPHLQGNKTAWEVRLLKSRVGDKEALLNNPDFLGQHTDSNSVGMIELTRPSSGESTIRDLRDWNSRAPYFLRDIREGQLHFYFSPTHGNTSRARAGNNPPIIAAIRYLTKAFQYGLKMGPEDLEQVRKIIADFNAKSPGSDYVKNWIEKNGKKLVQNAVDVQYAYEQLDQLGLRSKLIAIENNPGTQDSLAFWLSREPLRSRRLGTAPSSDSGLVSHAPGKTARELGIDTVAHETNHFDAYEAILRSPTGDPNVLISRKGAPGEAAIHGNGFYTQNGRTGGRGSKITIRFKLHPDSREGVDFVRPKDQPNMVIVTNRAALQVIPESLNLGPVEYFNFLATGEGAGDSDRGALEKLKRRAQNQFRSLDDDQYREIAQMIRGNAGGDISRMALVITEWNSLPRHRAFPLWKPTDLFRVLTSFEYSEISENKFLTDILEKSREQYADLTDAQYREISARIRESLAKGGGKTLSPYFEWLSLPKHRDFLKLEALDYFNIAAHGEFEPGPRLSALNQLKEKIIGQDISDDQYRKVAAWIEESLALSFEKKADVSPSMLLGWYELPRHQEFTTPKLKTLLQKAVGASYLKDHGKKFKSSVYSAISGFNKHALLDLFSSPEAIRAWTSETTSSHVVEALLSKVLIYPELKDGEKFAQSLARAVGFNYTHNAKSAEDLVFAFGDLLLMPHSRDWTSLVSTLTEKLDKNKLAILIEKDPDVEHIERIIDSYSHGIKLDKYVEVPRFDEALAEYFSKHPEARKIKLWEAFISNIRTEEGFTAVAKKVLSQPDIKGGAILAEATLKAPLFPFLAKDPSRSVGPVFSELLKMPHTRSWSEARELLKVAVPGGAVGACVVDVLGRSLRESR